MYSAGELDIDQEEAEVVGDGWYLCESKLTPRNNDDQLLTAIPQG